jgi:hypothetical protein
MNGSHGVGNEYFHGLPEQLGWLPTEYLGGASVRVLDHTLPVHDEGCIGCPFEQAPARIGIEHAESLAPASTKEQVIGASE